MTGDIEPAAPLRVALYEPEPDSAGHVAGIVKQAGGTVLPMPDPAISLRAWTEVAFDAVLANPFRSRCPPAVATALLRETAGHRAFIAITPCDLTEQRLMALQGGADDAVAMTADPREIVARLYALLRRRALSAGVLACDELSIDLIARTVRRAERAISMPLREFDLLARLARSADRVVSRHDLLRAVWRIDFDPGTNRIEVHVSRLRQRIDAGHSHAMLRTIKGSGYALVTRSGARMMHVASTI